MERTERDRRETRCLWCVWSCSRWCSLSFVLPVLRLCAALAQCRVCEEREDSSFRSFRIGGSENFLSCNSMNWSGKPFTFGTEGSAEKMRKTSLSSHYLHIHTGNVPTLSSKMERECKRRREPVPFAQSTSERCLRRFKATSLQRPPVLKVFFPHCFFRFFSKESNESCTNNFCWVFILIFLYVSFPFVSFLQIWSDESPPPFPIFCHLGILLLLTSSLRVQNLDSHSFERFFKSSFFPPP